MNDKLDAFISEFLSELKFDIFFSYPTKDIVAQQSRTGYIPEHNMSKLTEYFNSIKQEILNKVFEDLQFEFRLVLEINYEAESVNEEYSLSAFVDSITSVTTTLNVLYSTDGEAEIYISKYDLENIQSFCKSNSFNFEYRDLYNDGSKYEYTKKINNINELKMVVTNFILLFESNEVIQKIGDIHDFI